MLAQDKINTSQPSILIYPYGTINDDVKRIVTAVVAKEATKRR